MATDDIDNVSVTDFRKKKKKRKGQRSENIEGYNFDDEDVVSTTGGKKATKALNTPIRKFDADSLDSVMPSGLTKCQTICCLWLFGFLLSAGGAGLIMAGVMVWNIPDIYYAVGPCLAGIGLVLQIAGLVLFLRWCSRRHRRKTNKDNDSLIVASSAPEFHNGYIISIPVENKITPQEVNAQRRPSVAELYGSEESLSSRMRRGSVTGRADDADLALVYGDLAEAVPNMLVTYPNNPTERTNTASPPIFVQEWKHANPV